MRMEFWLISRPEVATPPALEALPGEYSRPLPWTAAMASGVRGMLAPSNTAMQPLAIRALAPASSISFWLAQGMAMSHFTFQMLRQPST